MAAATHGDRAATERMLAADPTLRQQATSHFPDQLVRAAERNSLNAAALLIDLGFDLNALSRTAPLHEAAMHGNRERIRLLIEHGADPNVHDRAFDAPRPAGQGTSTGPRLSGTSTRSSHDRRGSCRRW